MKSSEKTGLVSPTQFGPQCQFLASRPFRCSSQNIPTNPIISHMNFYDAITLELSLLRYHEQNHQLRRLDFVLLTCTAFATRFKLGFSHFLSSLTHMLSLFITAQYAFVIVDSRSMHKACHILAQHKIHVSCEQTLPGSSWNPRELARRLPSIWPYFPLRVRLGECRLSVQFEQLS